MTALYAFAAIFGGLLVLVFTFAGDIGGDADFDFDGDVDIDMDSGLDVAGTGDALQLFGAILSIRNIVFFAAFFGLTGLLLGLTNAAGVVVLITALAIGLAAAYMNHRLLRYLKQSSSDSTIGDDRIAGNVASVVLPIGNDRKGRVAVDVDGHRIYLVASPYTTTDTAFEVGDRVVIVEVANGSALVTAAEF